MVEESANHQPGPVDPSSTRCVLLTGHDGATPVDLLSGLSKRGVSTRVVAQPAEVMVELALQRTGILIVVDPTQQPALLDLIQAVKAYYPRTVRWAYQRAHPSGNPQLQPLEDRATPAPVSKAKPPTPKPAAPNSVTHESIEDDSPSPLARVQSQVPPERVRSLIVKVQGPAEVGEPLISEEELAMLLGPVPEEQGGDV